MGLSSSKSLSLKHLSESLRIAREQFGIASIVYATLDGILIYDRNRKGLLVQENCNKKDDGDNDNDNNDDDDNDVNSDDDNNGTIDEEIAFALEELEEEGMTTTAIERLVQCRENMNNMTIVDEEIVTNNETTKTTTKRKEYDDVSNDEESSENSNEKNKKEELKKKKKKRKKDKLVVRMVDIRMVLHEECHNLVGN